MSERIRLDWLLLAFWLPAQPGYLRVKVWRRLQGIGALSFRNSLYVLPASESAVEDFEWILREVREGGGDGAIFESQLLPGSNDETLTSLFNAAREDAYRSLAEELQAIAADLDRRSSRTIAVDLTGELSRTRKRLAAIEEIDFFNANGRERVAALLKRLEARVTATSPEVPAMIEDANVELRHRTWVTRAHVQVDRMASAWLIKRFIDPEAIFKFTGERRYRPEPGELRFDMFEAEYTHDSERCTFEVLLDLIEGKDAGLCAIAEIVHDLDLKDRKYEREEAAGVKRLLAGIIAGCERDEDRLERASMLLDDLHRSFLKPRQ